MIPKIYIVVPCYNEEAVLGETAKRLNEKMINLIDNGIISRASRVIFVNDGSQDKTWEIICSLHEQSRLFGGIKLSRNNGHQNALLAGLMTAAKTADAIISMDADLQDDISVIDEMIEKFKNGCDIVYGVRKNRKKDSFFKRFTAQTFYRIMKFMGSELIYNHADYRLMSKRAVEGLSEFKEVNLFLRGIIPMIGYKSDIVYYERSERFAGESKYPLKKMLQFSANGITSFSTKPIRMITGLGFFIFFISLIMFIYVLIRHFTGHTIIGWSSMVISVWAIGGLMLLSVGIVGEYIGKIYMETKERPRYIIEEYYNIDN